MTVKLNLPILALRVEYFVIKHEVMHVI